MSVIIRASSDHPNEEAAPLLVSVQQLPSYTGLPVPAQQQHQYRQLQAQRAATAAQMASLFFRVGALYGATAVALGAFGAHGLKKRIQDPNKISAWNTAAHYQLAHSVAMLVARSNPVAATCFATGMTLFSGSIYALTLDPERFKWMGPVTPIGGLFFIVGWLSLVFTRGAVLRI